jgi:glycosyltransferase involved in cell wall biosynthesis
MQASVIIPTHNRERILSRVLGYYACQVEDTGDFELVVVDDGSEDGTDRLFEGLNAMAPEDFATDVDFDRYRDVVVTAKKGWFSPDPPVDSPPSTRDVFLRYIKIRKSGRSKARNVGIGFSAHPLIIFADDDIFVEPAFVKKHAEAHAPDDLLVVMGRVIHTSGLDDPLSARWKPKDINTAFLATGNASLLKKYIVQAGLFDEWYTVYGWEDFDLGIHLQELGLRSEKRKVYGFHYDPSKRAQERSVNRDPGQIYEKERERGLSAVYFYREHPLPWVRRFTLVENRFLKAMVHLLGRKKRFLEKGDRALFGPVKLLVRYKGYFDGVDEGLSSPEGAQRNG